MDQYYSQVRHQVSSDLENGDVNCKVGLNSNSMKEVSVNGKTPQNISSSIVRKKSDPVLVSSNVRFQMLGYFLTNLQEVILGTKLGVLFPAIPLAIAADYYKLGRPWIFALSLLGLTPLAERVSFLTEQIAYFTGPTVGGLLNATCGNATELIIAILALYQNKIHVLKYSLLGSILSNLLLVLGTSLLCGGLANLKQEQRYDRKQADVNSLLLLLGLLCHMLPLMFRYAIGEGTSTDFSTLEMSRVSSIIMLIAYVAYIFFQLKTHRQLFDSQEEGDEEEEKAVIGFWSAFTWLAGMTIIIALLSEYVVGTIEAASDSWGISVSFLSIILLPIVGNAAEHAGSVIFAFKNKLDISLGVALGSATQISMFVVPLCVVVAWTMNIRMDLDFSLLETGSLAFTIIITAFTLQDGTSHYMKGLILFLCYIIKSWKANHSLDSLQLSCIYMWGLIPNKEWSTDQFMFFNSSVLHLNRNSGKESDNGAAANCVAIIFGVTGLVGREIARRLISKNKWKVYGVARRSESFPILSPNYCFISCDLLNPHETEKKLSMVQDVTHMFWVTWTSEFPLDSRECCEQNEAMMSNALNVILAKSEALKHVSLQTGMKHYISLRGPFDVKEEFIYDEKCPRASEGYNFYYVLEDLLKKRLAGKVAWSVLRPGLLMGSSSRTLYNIMGCLAIYGAICRHLNLPFVFGGTRECWEEVCIDGSDARLVAEQHIWAATDDEISSTDGQAFNAINGPSFTWKEIWPVLGKKFGAEVPEEMFSDDFWFAKAMGDKKKVWQEIVVKESLLHTEMEDLANWEFLDILFRCPMKMLGSRGKADRLGFTMRFKTLESILYWVDSMREEKIIPF
ncbi:hypothetical protein SADUNF_Sadunf09G0035500 [Salix dunnii]|uniref:Vacuolar cation/proton exchanger n=1 Tax=Salix dunnii TaxID=1413687 RepID=A0A835MSZ0_9ROSI|nr:hypothetical protein SADUNF_Sadunf09G0035500 [Salix dunnii]